MDNNLLMGACQTRREAAKGSLYNFAMLYMRHYLKTPPSAAHKAIYKKLDDLHEHRGRHLGIAGPRQFGKSSMISLIDLAYCVAYGTERYILIVSETARQAQLTLANLKSEFTNNKVLSRDFPELFGMKGRLMFPRWSHNSIETRNGIMISALGMGQGVRGTRYKEHRPSLVICDDIETANIAFNSELREKNKDWFEKVVLMLGTQETNYLVVGTIFNPYSILASCIKNETLWEHELYKVIVHEATNEELWKQCVNIRNGRELFQGSHGLEAAKKFYEAYKEAMDLGAESLWPEKWSYFDLYLMRDLNPISFNSEMMNSPLDVLTQIFIEHEITFWSEKYSSLEALLKFIGDDVTFIGACDPSTGSDPKNGDYSAIVIIARDNKTGVCYVIVADLERCKIDKTIQKILYYAQRFNFSKFVVETNGFQSMVIDKLKSEAAANHIHLPLEEVKNNSNKAGRIESLLPFTKVATLQFDKSNRQGLDQLLMFPIHPHDDFCDCLEMAFRASQIRGKFQVKIAGEDIVECDVY